MEKIITKLHTKKNRLFWMFDLENDLLCVFSLNFLTKGILSDISVILDDSYEMLLIYAFYWPWLNSDTLKRTLQRLMKDYNLIDN